MDLNSSHFFSFLFGFQAIFKSPSGILKETLNPSSRLNSFNPVPFELRSKKRRLILRPPVSNWLQLISAGSSTPLPQTSANQIKALLPHIDFHRTQNLTSGKRKTIQNRPRIDSEVFALHSIKPFTDKIFTDVNVISVDLPNANASVYHQMILLSLQMYHILEEISKMQGIWLFPQHKIFYNCVRIFFILSFFVLYILSFGLVRLRTLRLSAWVGAHMNAGVHARARRMWQSQISQ